MAAGMLVGPFKRMMKLTFLTQERGYCRTGRSRHWSGTLPPHHERAGTHLADPKPHRNREYTANRKRVNSRVVEREPSELSLRSNHAPGSDAATRSQRGCLHSRVRKDDAHQRTEAVKKTLARGQKSWFLLVGKQMSGVLANRTCLMPT